MKRLVVVLVSLIALGYAAAPALAKEGVEATLSTRIPLDASPGQRLEVRWMLAYLDDQGKRRPFNASSIFVRLVSASDGKPTIGFASADAHPTGEYVATVLVPKGGIGGIEIGIRGESDTGAGDLLFPIRNNPLPAPAKSASAPPAPASPLSAPAVSAASDEAEDGGFTTWMAVLLLLLLFLLALGSLGVFAWRRRQKHSVYSERAFLDSYNP